MAAAGDRGRRLHAGDGHVRAEDAVAAAFRLVDAANGYIAEHRAVGARARPRPGRRLSQVLFDVAEVGADCGGPAAAGDARDRPRRSCGGSGEPTPAPDSARRRHVARGRRAHPRQGRRLVAARRTGAGPEASRDPIETEEEHTGGRDQSDVRRRGAARHPRPPQSHPRRPPRSPRTASPPPRHPLRRPRPATASRSTTS